MDAYATIQAAMFAALGTKTKISRSGHSIVFSEPVCGRNDLSGQEGFALAQAREAGMDLEAVTPEQIQAYLDWHSQMHEARRINDARVLITRKFSLEVGTNSLEPGNRVTLIDGWGEYVASVNILCRSQWDSEATNRIGGLGAVVSSPDYAAIDAWIEKTRQAHPEFAGARVQDNNQEGRDG